MTHRWVVVGLVGTGLFLFLTLSHAVLSLIPQLADANEQWMRTIAFGFPVVADLLPAVVLAGLLFLIQRLGRIETIGGATGSVALPALLAMGGTVAAGESAGLLALGIVRAVILGVGVVGAAVLLRHLGNAAQALPRT